MKVTTPTERAELEERWTYLFSIPPGEVKHYEWFETATELRDEVERLRAALVTERAMAIAGTFPMLACPNRYWEDKARAELRAEGLLPQE